MFEELEYKYRADDISLSAFRELMASMPIDSNKEAASWDIYYVQGSDFDSFQRFRMDKDRPELTKKVKTKEANNWKRIESDLPLAPGVSEKSVSFHVGLDGYKENFRIYKYCDIYFDAWLNYVYYVVYDKNMKETGRFIEIEVNKNMVQHLGKNFPTNPMKPLNDAEKLFEKLGITPQNRLKKSLFEIYRKGA